MEVNEAQLQQSAQYLRSVLAGCLNTSTIKQSEQELMRVSNDPLFTTLLCYLIPSTDQNLKSMILTTLKNYLLARYNSPDNPMPSHQKDFLRSNLFKLFYQIYPESAPTKIFKEIMQVIILVDFPCPALAELLDIDLQGSVVAAVYFLRQVAKANEYTTGDERKRFEQVVMLYFPRLEDIVQKIFENYNQQTSELLYEALKAFYSSFHVEVPNYLRNFAALEKWLLYVQTILNVPSDTLSLKNQQLASRIYLRLFSLYANDTQDGKQYKGWAAQFRARFCQRLFQHVINLIGQRKGSEDMQSTLVNCLFEVVKQVPLRPLFTSQHCEVLLYGNRLLPLCQASQQQLTLFRDDPIEFVHRDEDLTCGTLRRAILDLVENVASSLSFNNKSEMIRMVEYSATVLQSNAPDTEKEVIIRVLSKIGKWILKNKFLKSQFQNLTVRFFIPLLGSNNPLLVALTLELLSRFLPFGELDNQTVNSLMELVYDRITNSQYLVIRFYAILAFTALLSHRAALEAAAPHFSRILEIYVGMLNSFEHESLLSCLQTIVQHFSNEVVAYAPELISHLVHLFASLCKQKQQSQDEDEPDSNTPATAALSTITQLLNCNLSQEVYLKVSAQITEMFRGIFTTYVGYFDAILSLFNVLVHRAKVIVDFNYPYAACRKLLEGDNSILAYSQLPHQIALQISNVEKADGEYQQDLLSILKNLIQKMPNDLLTRYPYPNHPQILLCLVENRRLSMDEIGQLLKAQIDQVWRPYIFAYARILYGIGDLPPSSLLTPIVGVSLQPWIKSEVTTQIVKMIINAYQIEEEEEDDLYEQNTAQLLEKYANEDDEDEDQFGYGQGSGISYAYHYDTPFDSSKDRANLIYVLKNLSQKDAQELAQKLSNKYRKKLEALFNQA